MKRRHVVTGLTTMALCNSGIIACTQKSEDTSQNVQSRVIRLGALDQFPMGKTERTLERLLVVRDAQGIGVMSLVCTHQTCLIRLSSEHELFCPCHGSTFTPRGVVTKGPASSDLPWYRVRIAGDHTLEVVLSEVVAPDWRLPV